MGWSGKERTGRTGGKEEREGDCSFLTSVPMSTGKCWDDSCHLCREHNPEEDPAGEDSLCTLLEKRQRRENRDPDLGQ